MSDIFQIASVGLSEGRQQLEAVSQNAANATLPGYRSHVMTARNFDQVLATGQLLAQTESLPLGVNLQRGGLMATGHVLDVAIDTDDSFFALTDGSQTWLTRSGAFHLAADGSLVGERGMRVVGTGAEVHLPGNDVTVEADGRIVRQGVTVATLQLFKPNDPSGLRAGPGSLLSASAGIHPADSVRVRGGDLEASNTDTAHEMIDLMSLARQFESLSRIVQGYDDVLGHAIEKLGEV